MIVDKNRIFDGWRTLEGGVDGGRQPNTIDPNQCVSAINMTFRGGSATTRPGFRKLTEDFPTLGGQKWCFNKRHVYTDPTRVFIKGEYKPNNINVTYIGTCEFSTGSPIISVQTVHGMAAGQLVTFTTTGTLPGVIHAQENYFVLALGLTATTLRISHTDGGPAIVFGGTGSGTHSIWNRSGAVHWFTNENSEFIYKNGILQTAEAYSPHNGEDCIMAMIGGRLFKIVPGVTTAKVNEVVIEDTTEGMPHNLRNNKLNPLAYMVQADKWMIIQDGVGSAIIYDASIARRSDTTGTVDETEIPVGTIMAYGMGRVCVVVNKRDVAFGDLYGSHDLPDPADSLLLFTERNFLAEGFDAAIPFTQGIATGMMFFPQLDTSTGNGQLMVFAERGGTSFFLSLPREEWKTSTFQILSLLTTGLRGHRSISAVNEDLWFRSDDGVRSYRQARSEQGGWAHIPLSTNVRQFLENDSDWLLKFCSAIYFDNRIIITTSPMWNNGRPIHYGLIVVDFDVISSFGGSIQAPQASKPAWEGQWTSSRFLPMQLLTGTFNGQTRAFCFGMDSHGQNQLFELSKDDRDDWDGEHIPFEFTTRTMDFQKLDPSQSSQFTENELYDADVWLREIIE